MTWSIRFLTFSRPLTYLAVLTAYIINPAVTPAGLAIYVVSAAFFLASSAICVDWIPAGQRWRHFTMWAEIGAITLLAWYTTLSYQSDVILSMYMVNLVSIPLCMERQYRRPTFILLLTCWFTALLPSWNSGNFWLELGVYGAAMLFFASNGVLLRSLMDERDRSQRLLGEVTASREALERAHRQLQESAASQQQLAVLEERQRLAREIHDGVAHGLTALVVQTQAARRILDKDPARATETIARCEEMAREALQDTRRAVRALHPAGLEQQSDVEALSRLARDFGIATGMQIVIRADAAVYALPPDPTRLEQLYRIFQEALSNAHRHGQAQTVHADLEVSGGAVQMVIGNDGQAPPPQFDLGVGLRSMAERARSIGGSLTFERGPVGLTIRVTVPVKREVAG